MTGGVAHNALHIGFFKDFNSNDTLLLEGDSIGLGQLESAIRSLADGTNATLALHTLPFVDARGSVEIIVMLTDRDLGIHRVDSTTSFVWQRTEAGWRDIAGKIVTLIGSVRGHHYLEAESDDVTVEVSKGEYGDNWWTAISSR